MSDLIDSLWQNLELEADLRVLGDVTDVARGSAPVRFERLFIHDPHGVVNEEGGGDSRGHDGLRENGSEVLREGRRVNTIESP